MHYDGLCTWESEKEQFQEKIIVVYHVYNGYEQLKT